MKKKIYFLFAVILGLAMNAMGQPALLKGRMIDQQTGEPVAGGSISIYTKGRITGVVSNGEGGFVLPVSRDADSLRITMIGYQTRVIKLPVDSFLTIIMEHSQVVLEEVVVKPITALEIIQKSIEATQKMLPSTEYENHFFYREIIKDSANYYSIAEAVFKSQFIPSSKSSRLQLEKGRSKEDVANTRMFEDFHPGGGPEGVINKSLSIDFPDFLDTKKTKWYLYHRDSIVRFDQGTAYVISFDQKPDVKEALDKGKIYISTDDYSVISYQITNSPRGTAYIKNLTGTDKIFAQLLHIDFIRKGWVAQVNFTKRNGRLVLKYANAEYRIIYRQPKKNIDLDLTINTELAVTDESSPVGREIVKGEEWKRKNIVANLPSDFDTDFWGDASIISPTTQLDSVIASIGKKNNDDPIEKIAGNWQYHQKDHFVAYRSDSSIALVPIMKGAWEDEETAGMIYQTITGDFILETKLDITKRSTPGEFPDYGFQQAGIIIRDGEGREENSVILCLGTGGNSNPKYFIRKTENGKSKGPVDKTENMNEWLRLEKKATTVSCFIKSSAGAEWEKITSYKLPWLNKPVQAGLMVMARFAGNGPKMKPDMKAIFSHYILKGN